MKKIITTIICVLILAAAHAQKITESEAQQFLETVWGYLKVSDSISFVNLWSPEDSVWQRLNAPAKGFNPMDSYHRLKKFLAPAVSANQSIDQVDIGGENARGTEITATFRMKQNAYLGFTFYVVNINGKWIPRGKPYILASTNR